MSYFSEDEEPWDNPTIFDIFQIPTHGRPSSYSTLLKKALYLEIRMISIFAKNMLMRILRTRNMGRFRAWPTN